MKAGILFEILLTLIEKKKVTRRYLCEKFELSMSSIARYISELIACKLPIITYPGKDGGIGISEDYCFERDYFTIKEKERLIDCIQATTTLYNDNTNGILLQKLKNNTSKKKVTAPILHQNTLYIDANGWTNPNFYREKIAQLQIAMQNSLSINISYTNMNDISSSRKIDPYTLALKDGIWYIYGWCHLREDFRLFRLSRIFTLSTTNEVFKRKENANIVQKLNGDFEETQQITLTIEFSNTRYIDIEEWLGKSSIIESGQKYKATAIVYSGSMLISKLMSFGCDIKIISPSFVREELTTECKRMLDYNTL